jgi:hypothetical protein
MRWTKEKLETKVAALPSHIKTEIICGVAWNMFGEVDFDESAHINPERRFGGDDMRRAAAYLRDQLKTGRPELTVKEVIRNGELEIVPGHTMAEITEMACECLDGANSWDICGEILFLGNDDRYYVGTVEFVIAPGNPAYVEQALGENKDDQGGSDDDEETE